MVHNKTERYVRPFVWDDTFEGCGLRYVLDKKNYRCFVEALFEQYCYDEVPVESVLYNYAKAEIINTYFYGQCWSLISNSDALWRIYSYDNKAIQIESNISRITNGLDIESYRPNIQRVKYDVKDSDKDSSFIKFYKKGKKFDNQFFHKRQAFMHEKEVRVIIRKSDFSKVMRIRQDSIVNEYRKTKGSFCGNDVDHACSIIEDNWFEDWKGISKNDYEFINIHSLSDYIESVRVHPLADKAYVDLIEKICRENNIQFKGKSNLYTEYARCE